MGEDFGFPQDCPSPSAQRGGSAHPAEHTKEVPCDRLEVSANAL